MGVSRIEGGEGAIERHFKKLDFLKKKKNVRGGVRLGTVGAERGEGSSIIIVKKRPQFSEGLSEHQ